MTLHFTCLHASASNIVYIDSAFNGYDVELTHVVDDELIHQIGAGVSQEVLAKKVMQQLQKIEQAGGDCILITCTNYIALLEELTVEIKLPIIKIDDPIFKQVAEAKRPTKLLFTNEATIQGTMKRFKACYSPEQEVEVILIPNAFELYLAGETVKHDQRIIEYLVSQDLFEYTVAAGQLSMSNAVRMYSKLSGNPVINPINALQAEIVNRLELLETRNEN